MNSDNPKPVPSVANQCVVGLWPRNKAHQNVGSISVLSVSFELLFLCYKHVLYYILITTNQLALSVFSESDNPF